MCVGISGRHGSEYAASNQDRSPTQQTTERNAPSPDSSCERFHEKLLWCFREHHSRGVVMHLALLIGGEAVMSLGVKDVRHTGFKLAAHNYGNVMDVSHLGKNSDRHPIQGDSEMKMRGSQLLVSWHCVVVRGSEAIPLLPEPPPRDRHLVFGRAECHRNAAGLFMLAPDIDSFRETR